MEHATPPKRRQTIPILLFILFLIVEIVSGQVAGDDIGFQIQKSIFISIFLVLAYRQLTWAIWSVGIVMILQGLVCILGAWEEEKFIFLLFSLFYILFGLYIINARPRPIRSAPVPDAAENPAPEETVTPILPAAAYPQKPVHSQGFIAQGKEYIYPFLIKRYQAVFIDMLVLFAILITIMMLTDERENGSTIMVISGLSIILLYEPLLTAYGVTIGQLLAGVRVRKIENPTERISVFNAYLRIVTKLSLGTISFFTIHANPEHRAIHDLASGAVVIREVK